MRFAAILSTTFLLLFLTACGTGFESTTSSRDFSSESQDSSGNSNTNTGEAQDTNESLNLSFSGGYNDNLGIFGSGQILNFNNETQSLEVALPFPFGAILQMDAQGYLPNAPHVEFKVLSQQNKVVLSIPVKHYVELTQNPTSLPNGRTLPGISGGEPPSFGFSLPGIGTNSYVYASLDSFSVFTEVNVQLPIAIQLSFPIKSPTGEHLGSLYWLPQLNGAPSGVFLSFTLPRELSAFLAKNL